MECYERGLLDSEATDGLDLRFGNAPALLEMLRRIVCREGLGDLLAEGSCRAADKIGGDAPRYSIHIKGQELAMHDPRVKYGHALGIALSPTGADHMHSLHDNMYQTEAGIQGLKPVGVLEPVPYDDIGPKKVHLVRQTIMWRVTYNVTGICMFHGWSPQQNAQLVSSATGWNTSVMELWLAAERAYNMARAFNVREGFCPADDMLPGRLFEPLPAGPMAGKVYTREAFVDARDRFYAMMGWDVSTGTPKRAKLENLDLGWVADLLEDAP
jgi:aldehyde:ferredoxin oxidoreductase